MKHFIIKLTGITVAIAAISAFVFVNYLPEYYLPIFPFLLLFFYVFTTLVHRYLLKQSKANPKLFIQSTMVLTVVRLLLYSIIAIIYILVDKENAIPFAVGLMILYLIFTFFEVCEVCKIAGCRKKNNA